MAYEPSWWKRTDRVLSARGTAARQESSSPASVSSPSFSSAAPSTSAGSASRAGEYMMVDALEEGAIVRVAESYARREGLPILRRFSPHQQAVAAQAAAKPGGPKETGGIDTYRRPLRSEARGVRASLTDNFHWELQRCRRERRMTRKQMAEAVHVKEQDIKLIENGVLPANDFVLVSALEQYFNITLRKEGAVASPPPARALGVMREQPRWIRIREERQTRESKASELRERESKTSATRENRVPSARESTTSEAREQRDELTGSGIELADE